jgi:PBP1b-binding outer membrane lipoprotein LpoB
MKTMMRYAMILISLMLLILAGCGDEPKNYDSFAQCL